MKADSEPSIKRTRSEVLTGTSWEHLDAGINVSILRSDSDDGFVEGEEANGAKDKDTPHKKRHVSAEIAARDQDKEEEGAMRNDPDAVRRRVTVRNLVITGKSGGV